MTRKPKDSNAAIGLFIAIGLTVLGYFILTSVKYYKSRDRVVNVKGLLEREVAQKFATDSDNRLSKIKSAY